jgi:hypothetical protein
MIQGTSYYVVQGPLPLHLPGAGFSVYGKDKDYIIPGQQGQQPANGWLYLIPAGHLSGNGTVIVNWQDTNNGDTTIVIPVNWGAFVGGRRGPRDREEEPAR